MIVWNPRIHLPVLALLVYVLWLAIAPPSTAQELVGGLGVVAARVAAAFALLGAARRQPRRIWSYLAVAATLWAVAGAISLTIRLMSEGTPDLPSAYDLIYTAGYLAALTGSVTHRPRDPERFGRMREILDVAILILAVGTLAWILLLRPALSVGFGGPISLIWAAIAPTLDLILVVLFLRIAMRSVIRERARPFVYLAGVFGILAMSDLANSYARLVGEVTSVGFIEVGWIAAALVMLNVGMRVGVMDVLGSRSDAGIRRAAAKIEPLIPLGLTYLVVGSALLGWWLTGQVDWITVLAAATLSLMLVARQGVLIGQRELSQYAQELEIALTEVANTQAQLEQLNLRLEQKVSARTAQLEKTVSDLERLNEELKELDQLKSEFVALVSHELRAPLTNIRTGIELIMERTPELKADRLEAVQEEIDRLGGLVEAILDISALEAGRFPLNLQAVRLEPLADEVIAQMAEPERLQQEFPEKLPPVLADERGLKSVLYHLLDNATKYAPKGELVLEAEPSNGTVLVSLSDSGPGIPTDERERVFDMFHRLDTSDAREVYGHGLGLPMARKLVEAMGGGIRAEPSDSAGARFVFWLPQSEVN